VTALGNISAGSRLTAAMLQGVAPWAVYKSVAQTVTDSTTLVNDSQLYLPLLGQGTWAWRLWAPAVSSLATGSGDLKIAFTWPSGVSVAWGAIGYSASASSAVNINAVRSTSGSTSSIGVGTTQVFFTVEGTLSLTSSVSGNLQFQFAQNTASSGATVTVGAGAFMAGWQIA
jgi:hypothetical protein